AGRSSERSHAGVRSSLDLLERNVIIELLSRGLAGDRLSWSLCMRLPDPFLQPARQLVELSGIVVRELQQRPLGLRAIHAARQPDEAGDVAVRLAVCAFRV